MIILKILYVFFIIMYCLTNLCCMAVMIYLLKQNKQVEQPQPTENKGNCSLAYSFDEFKNLSEEQQKSMIGGANNNEL